jgi:two-component system KDP operon response regulator KdpE
MSRNPSITLRSRFPGAALAAGVHYEDADGVVAAGNAMPEATSQVPGKRMKGKLLVVDDETAIRWALRNTLQRMNFEISEAETGEQAIALVRTIRFDAVLLDIGMPGMSGFETCRRIRKLVPLLGIIMLTVKNAEEDKIQALDAGADDYITKPFHVGELAARLRAAVRRSNASQVSHASAISIGEIELDPARRLVKRAGTAIHLTAKEFELLHFLMAHAGFPLTHARILAAVWGPEYGGELEYLRTFVRQLRKKLGDDASRPKYLVTDAQVGYRFRAEVDLPVEGEREQEP